MKTMPDTTRQDGPPGPGWVKIRKEQIRGYSVAELRTGGILPERQSERKRRSA